MIETLVPLERFVPALMACLAIRPFLTFLIFWRLTLPSLQWPLVSSFLPCVRVLPASFGTTHLAAGLLVPFVVPPPELLEPPPVGGPGVVGGGVVVGGLTATTVTVADAAAPGPPSVDLIGSVVLF